MKTILIAEANVKSAEKMTALLDRFREAALPSLEFGLTLYQATPEDKVFPFPTSTVRLKSRGEAQLVATELLVSSQWFEMTPLPDDQYEITFKPENKDKVRLAASSYHVPTATKDRIIQILQDHGEGFIDIDAGVDPNVCNQVADEILGRLGARVVVHIKGGNLQGAWSNIKTIAFQLFDGDIFDSEEKDRTGRTEEEFDAALDAATNTLSLIL
jgi:hypothetical protein